MAGPNEHSKSGTVSQENLHRSTHHAGCVRESSAKRNLARKTQRPAHRAETLAVLLLCRKEEVPRDSAVEQRLPSIQELWSSASTINCSSMTFLVLSSLNIIWAFRWLSWRRWYIGRPPGMNVSTFKRVCMNACTTGLWVKRKCSISRPWRNSRNNFFNLSIFSLVIFFKSMSLFLNQVFDIFLYRILIN